MFPITKRNLTVCALLFLLAAILVKPLFKLGFTDKWGSVEGAIISDARFLNDHWPHPSWQPLWYAGARFDGLFPPAVRYGTVAVAKLTRVPVVRAYHTYSALLYCFGIVAVYFFIWTMSGARWVAWFGAAAAALVSPCFLFIPELRNDAWLWVPQRLGAMMRYGDGPHIASLAVLPFALSFWWRALVRFDRADFALACLCGAVVMANSLAGAGVLVVLLPVMMWSLYVTHLDQRIWLRFALLAGLTWGLSAFWLVPSMIRISIANTQLLSPGGTTWSLWIALLVAITFVLVTNAKFRGRADLAYLLFLIGASSCFALNVVGHYYFGFLLAGAPMHFAPELDLFLILLGVECLRRLRWRPVAFALGLVALATSGAYLRRAWHVYPADFGYKERTEHKLQDWVSQNFPDARVMVAGAARFWFDAWSDRMQLGGGAESGPPEAILKAAQFQILRGKQPELALLWMQILGIDAVVLDTPEKKVDRVPRRFPALARVVNTDRLNALRTIASNDDAIALRAHYVVFEQGPDVQPAVQWEGTDAMRVRARVEAGQSLVVQTMYDGGWHAYSNGARIPLQKGVLGFIRLDPPPGDLDIRLVFKTPWEIWFGRFITLVSLVVLVRRRSE